MALDDDSGDEQVAWRRESLAGPAVVLLLLGLAWPVFRASRDFVAVGFPVVGEPMEFRPRTTRRHSSPTTTTGKTTTTVRRNTTSTRPHASTAAVAEDMVANYRAVHAFFNDTGQILSRTASLSPAAQRLQAAYPKSFGFARDLLRMEAQNRPHPTQAPPTKPVRLLIVTITMSHEMAYREVHRRTWMSRPGVCRVNASALQPAAGCRLFATFAVGLVGGDGLLDREVDAEAAAHGDVVRVNATDPQPLYLPVEGRQYVPHTVHAFQKEKDSSVLLFFRQHWPWATHLGKSDLDNHPQPEPILADLEAEETKEAASGAPKPLYYGARMGEEKIWKEGFMQGQFYAMSRLLVDCLMDQLFGSGWYRPSDFVEPRHQKPPCFGVAFGDTMVGCLVKTWTLEKEKCAAPRWVNVRNTVHWHMRKP